MLRVGTKVKAKYLATSAGVRCPGDWFTGKIAKVNQDGTYNVVYDDGDRENAVLARYIKADGASADGEAANKRPAEHPPPEAEGSRRRGKRPAVEQEQPVAAPNNSDDDEVIMADAPEAGSSFTTGPVVGANDKADDADDEVQYQGRTGDVALADFPHARENCAAHPFGMGKDKEHCPNCYCYVCDIPAADCKHWTTHCKASHSVESWVAERKRWKETGGLPVAGKKKASAANAAPPVHFDAYTMRWKMDEILAKVQMVYPIESPEPEGFTPGITLRPYQKQSLAFMLQNERSNDASLVGNDGVRGGWLCDEVGMGKTAVCAALILANKCKAKPVPDEAFKKLLTPFGSANHTYKLTLVIVNNTLVGQWVDELHRFAPDLDVRTYYGGQSAARARTLAELRQVDVLITTPHMVLPENMIENLHVHRMIVDEAHLLSHGSGTTASKLSTLQKYKADYKWLVTGTPFTTSLDQLQNQALLLGQWDHGTTLRDIAWGRLAPGGPAWPPPTSSYHYDRFQRRPQDGYSTMYHYPKNDLTNEQVVALLQKVLIRHTKSQRIGGEVALALPEKDMSTRWLDFSEDEKIMYATHACMERIRGRRYASYSRADPERAFCHEQLNACSHLYNVDIITGAHKVFREGLAKHYKIDAFVLISQWDSHDRLEKAKKEGGYNGKTYDVGQFKVDVKPFTAKQQEERWRCQVVNLSAIEKKKELARLEKERVEHLKESQKQVNLRKEPRARLSLDSPSPLGAFAAATAAFKRSHIVDTEPAPKLKGADKKNVELGIMPAPPSTVEVHVPLSSLSKFRALIDDLKTLRAEEPACRVIVFTRHVKVQQRLVKLLAEASEPGQELHQTDSKLGIFEFTKQTTPQRRHRLIKDFQDPSAPGARVFIVTYDVAAVGITLTAANRVFLMEPCLDPGQEIQAAGRVHRLGQTKGVFIVRYCFRNSIEEAVVELHRKVSAKEVDVVGGKVKTDQVESVFDAWMERGTHTPAARGWITEKDKGKLCPYRVPDELVYGSLKCPYGDDSVTYLSPQFNKMQAARSAAANKFEKNNTWSNSCSLAPCTTCGRTEIVPGTYKWAGTGLCAYLQGDRRDPPRNSFRTCFHLLPRPPNGWKGMSLEETDNGGELPGAAGSSGS